MAAKRFLNLFKSHHKRDNNKENNDDPLLLLDADEEQEELQGRQFHGQNGGSQQRRAQRRVNFQQSGVRGNGNGGVRRRSCVTEVDEDGASEVTLTATEAGRQFPPNPYSVLTQPKRNQGPRSCPGGAPIFDFDSLEDSSGPTATNHDRSLEARSEFLPAQQPQHRRSNRRRAVGGGQQLQQPFTEIGNRSGASHWDGGNNGGFARYKNLPLADPFGMDTDNSGQQQRQLRQLGQMREQQKELAELGFAYKQEKARRRALQKELRTAQAARETLAMENFQLRSIVGLLFRQQHQQHNTGAGIVDLGSLLSALGLCPPAAWNANTPSSSSALGGPLSSGATTSNWTPNGPSLFNNTQFHGQQVGAVHQRRTGPGECLAPPLLSSSSLLCATRGPETGRAAAQQQHSGENDEIKVFRTGQHNTDSFSGGSSSRPTSDLIRDKQELVSEEDSSREHGISFSSLEVARCSGTLLPMLGTSFSADQLGQLLGLGHRKLEEDSGSRMDDGYATSETNGQERLSGEELAKRTTWMDVAGQRGGAKRLAAVRSKSAETL